MIKGRNIIACLKVAAKSAAVVAIVACLWFAVGRCQSVEELNAWSAGNDRATAAMERANALRRAGLSTDEAWEEFYRERDKADGIAPPNVRDDPQQ